MQRIAIFLAAGALALVTLACGALPRVNRTPAPTPTPVVIVVTATPNPENLPAGTDTGEERVIRVYQNSSPAVVNITSRVIVRSFFFGDYPEEGSGSGFVWDKEGHIVTNYHVVENADSLAVNFGDDNAISAKIIGVDPSNDLAVIQVENLPDEIEPLKLGDSKILRVGQTAVAIGNPFGQFERTLTTGVISALNRTIETENRVLRGAIQTDASINRGNSGGPLLNSSGELIGVNSAIFSPSGTSAGVGFAIPVNTVKRVVPVLIKEGRYPRAWLGAVGYDITPQLARQLKLPVDRGLLVAQIYRNSPAQQVGLRGAQDQIVVGNQRLLVGGDIINAINGQPLKTWSELDAFLEERASIGQTVTLDLLRDGKNQQISVKLAEEPAQF